MKNFLLSVALTLSSTPAWSFITVVDYRDPATGVRGTVSNEQDATLDDLKGKDLTYRGRTDEALALMEDIAAHSERAGLVFDGVIEAETGIISFHAKAAEWTAYWIIRTGNDAPAIPTGVRLARVEVIADSVKVVESRTILDGFHSVTLAFDIAPAFACQSAFVGLANVAGTFQDPQYLAVFNEDAGDCSLNPVPSRKTVRSRVFLNVRSNHAMTINGVEYRFRNDGVDVQIAR